MIGKVVDCVPHPNADRLRITQVDVGEKNTKQIICGAPNVQKNQFVVVVLEGKTLIDKDGKEFKIKPYGTEALSKLRIEMGHVAGSE